MRFHRLLHALRDQAGAVLLTVALLSSVLLSAVAIAVDVGVLMTARTESQRVADASALAGAGALAVFPGDATAARDNAKQWAGQNDVRGQPVTLLDSDIDVDLTANTVRVTVHHTDTRGNPIPTIFARVFGVDHVDVVTTATAEAAHAGAATCPLPISLLDDWQDDGDGIWEPDEDTYVPYPESGYTGYDDDDVGLQIQIKTQPSGGSGGGGGCSAPPVVDACNQYPGWYCWYFFDPANEDGSGGVSTLGPRIYPGCTDPSTAENEEVIYAASGAGNKQTLVTKEFVQLVDSDPTVSWDDTQKCVVRDGECTDTSTRIRAVPLVRPDQLANSGANVTGPIVGFTGVFVEKVSCSGTMPHKAGPPGQWNVYIRLMPFEGLYPGTSLGGGASGPLSRAIRLIQ